MGDYAHEVMLAIAGAKYVRAVVTHNRRVARQQVEEGAKLIFHGEGEPVPNPLSRLDQLLIRSTLASFGMNAFLNRQVTALGREEWDQISTDPEEVLAKITPVLVDATMQYRVAFVVQRAQITWRERATDHEGNFNPNGSVKRGVLTDALNEIGIPWPHHRELRTELEKTIQSHLLYEQAMLEQARIQRDGGVTALIPDIKLHLALRDEAALVDAVKAVGLLPAPDLTL